MKYKRRSTRLSISQKNPIQPTSRLPVLNPKLAPKLPDELRKKWIRNPDIGLVVLNDENRPLANTAKNLSEVIEEYEEEDYMDEANELMESNRPSTSAMPPLRNLSLQDDSRTNDETWLLEEGDVNMESLLELSAEEDQRKSCVLGSSPVYASQVLLCVPRTFMRPIKFLCVP
uniref:Uncharacterized protein n=1 Tax=Acrobeloides nanus TaxID=290746 RepID=A0A914EHD0_9BILA